MINTLSDAQALCEQIGSRYFGIAADTYHMNIEEADPPIEAGAPGSSMSS
jgi:sugar phosphate isomerase/epimerase